MKTFVLPLIAVCVAAGMHAQNITRFAGIFNALDYAYGVPGSSPGGLKISVGNQATGTQTVTVDFGYTTLSDGTKIFPLSTNAPIMVGTEIVTPASVTCPSPTVYSTCQFSAAFTRLHGPGDNVTSATYGLQEAINSAHILGGSVVVDGKWTAAGGTSAMISAAIVFGNAAIADNRLGQVFGGGGGGGAVSSVFGRTGTVTAQTGDYSAAQVTNAASTNAANTFGAFAQSFSSATSLIMPIQAAAAPTVQGSMAFDSITHTYQVGNGSTTDAVAYFNGSPPTSGNCLQTGTGAYQVVSTGSPCGGGGSGINQLTGDVTAGPGTGSQAATLAAAGSAGSCGDATHSCQLTFDTKGRETARANVAISGGAGGTASSIVSGTLSVRPVTCATADIYFATDQPAGQQLYQCDSTNHWTQWLGLGASGALAFTSGLLDITSLVPLKAAANAFTGLNSFAVGQDMSEQASGTTPAAGKLHLYGNVDGTFHQVNPAGVDTPLGGGGVTTHWVRATSSVTQTIPGSFAATNILYDTNNASTTNAALHSTVTNTQNFVADTTGIWAGNCEISTTTSTVDMQIVVFVNGTAIANEGAPGLSSGTGGWERNLPWSYPLTSGDIVKCQAVSSSGFTASAGEGTQFYMYLVH